MADRDATDAAYLTLRKTAAAIRTATERLAEIRKMVPPRLLGAVMAVEREYEEAAATAERACGIRTGAVLTKAGRDDDTPREGQENPEKRRSFAWIEQREQFRARLFSLASPRRLLKPVNILERYLAEAEMWESWTWDATAAINARMLPYVQQLDAAHPLPDDARLALPVTAAAAHLHQALHISLDTPPTERTAAVYRAILDGVVTISRLEPPEGLGVDFYEVADTAQLMLAHTLRFALDAGAQHDGRFIGYGLVQRCGLGIDCKRGGPFYIKRSDEKDPHGACRITRFRIVRGGVTATPNKRKKSRRSRSA